MRIMIFINGHLQVIKIHDIIDAHNGCLYIPATPYGKPLVIKNILDTVYILNQLNMCGWADLSMCPAEYINVSYSNYETASDDMEREINPFEFER